MIELGPDTAGFGHMEMEGEEVNTLWKSKVGLHKDQTGHS